MNDTPRHLSSQNDPSQPESPAPPRSVDAETLFRGQREVFIRHDGQDYRLRITSQNKLILTK